MTWFQRGILLIGGAAAGALMVIAWCLFLLSRTPFEQCARLTDEDEQGICWDKLYAVDEVSGKELLAAVKEAKEAAESAESAALLD